MARKRGMSTEELSAKRHFELPFSHRLYVAFC